MNTMKKGEKPGLDYLFDQQEKQEKVEREAKAEERKKELMLDLEAIYERAFQAAINVKYAEYQQRINTPELPVTEKEALEAELNDFKQNPERYGITRKNSPIVDDFDKQRVMKIVEELTDKEGLSKDKAENFIEAMRGFADRHAKKVEAENKKISGRGD